jgi:hypothetical protein
MDPWIVFPGNIQGRNVRETHERGAMLVTVERGQTATPKILLDFYPLDDARWIVLEIDATPLTSDEGLLDLIRTRFHELRSQHEPRAIVVRIEVIGASVFSDVWHANDRKLTADVLAVAQSISADIVLDKIRVRTTQKRQRGAITDDEPLSAIDDVIRRYLDDEALANALAADLAGVVGNKLPVELTSGVESLAIDSLDFVTAVLADSGPFLRQRLAGYPDSQDKTES